MNLTHLKRYTRPSHFADFATFDRNEYYVAYGQHRDSDTLTRSNFRVMLAKLGGESETVLVVRDSHCMVGWVEAIYIHESDTARLIEAYDILDKLDNYPVVDEEDWSDLQRQEAAQFWQVLSLRERIDVCERFDISPFAARRTELPEDPRGGLIDYLSDGV